MLAQLNDCIGGLLHLGPNVITFRALLHLGPNVITFRTLLHLGKLLHTFNICGGSRRYGFVQEPSNRLLVCVRSGEYVLEGSFGHLYTYSIVFCNRNDFM